MAGWRQKPSGHKRASKIWLDSCRGMCHCSRSAGRLMILAPLTHPSESIDRISGPVNRRLIVRTQFARISRTTLKFRPIWRTCAARARTHAHKWAPFSARTSAGARSPSSGRPGARPPPSPRARARARCPHLPAPEAVAARARGPQPGGRAGRPPTSRRAAQRAPLCALLCGPTGHMCILGPAHILAKHSLGPTRAPTAPSFLIPPDARRQRAPARHGISHRNPRNAPPYRQYLVRSIIIIGTTTNGRTFEAVVVRIRA